MTYELLSALGSIGAFFVIAATAIAAMIQLRHMRASNQFNAVRNMFAQRESPEMQRHFNFVRDELAQQLENPAFRAGLQKLPIDRIAHPEMHVLDYYQLLGDFVENGLVDQKIILQIEAFRIGAIWDLLEPALAVMRRDGSQYYAKFERLAAEAKRYIALQHHEAQSRTQRHLLPVRDRWKQEDA